MHREVAALLTAICIRSLLGCCFSSLLLLAHKGIELSDVQFEVTTDEELARSSVAALPSELRLLSVQRAGEEEGRLPSARSLHGARVETRPIAAHHEHRV